jgi:excisionase family DNA binding protein
MPQIDSVPDLVTTQQAADVLNYTIQHTRLLIRQGRLHGVKIGRDWLIRRDSFDQFVRERNGPLIREGAEA